MPVILVIEDHPKLLRSVVKTLDEAGYETLAAETLTAAQQAMSSTVGMIVLDLMLPDGDGLAWLSELRASGNRTPCLILTARDTIPDRVAGLDRGADDYLVKPFALDELLARIRALHRRQENPSAVVLTVGDLSVDLLARTAIRGGVALELQNRQFELLVYLLRHANQIVTRQMISHDVWKESTTTWTNVIEVHVNQLRKQLERSGGPSILHTVRGKGYLLGDAP
jgi:DNA-binding response OmpR family regulator